MLIFLDSIAFKSLTIKLNSLFINNLDAESGKKIDKIVIRTSLKSREKLFLLE